MLKKASFVSLYVALGKWGRMGWENMKGGKYKGKEEKKILSPV